MYHKHILTLSSYKKKNHIIEKFNNNYAVKHSHGTMVFDIKRYKYKLKIIQIFIMQIRYKYRPIFYNFFPTTSLISE